MIRKLKIILVLVVVPISFFVVKAVGEQDDLEQAANVGDQVINQSFAQVQADGANQDSSKVLAEHYVSTSPNFLTNIHCGEDVSLSARLALVRFLNDNNRIYELNVNSHWPLASITKLVTALVAEENFDLKKTVTITDQMVLAEGEAGGFKTGEVFRAEDLIKAMLMLSSNDAAEALAQDFSRDEFIGLMNKKVAELGLGETMFFDPTGLSPKNQSTPNDIFKIVSYIYENRPDILKITTYKADYITDLNSKKKRKILNINEFAGQSDFIGGKTGFIDEAQGNLVSVFSVKKEPVTIVVLGSQDRFGETKKLLQCVQNPDVQDDSEYFDVKF